MIKIVCNEYDEDFAHRVVEAARKYCGCPPIDCNSTTASCELCFENYIKIEVEKDNTDEQDDD